MDITIITGIIAGVLTGISLLPQLIKLLRERKGDDISIGMLVCLLAGLVCWIVYGCLKMDYPILITNSFSLLVNITIICLKYYYARRSGNG